jgi:hypothetical protein
MWIIGVFMPDQHSGIHTCLPQSQMLAVSRPGGSAIMVMGGKVKDFHCPALKASTENVPLIDLPTIEALILTIPKKDCFQGIV